MTSLAQRNGKRLLRRMPIEGKAFDLQKDALILDTENR
jgi:hypothetical protein